MVIIISNETNYIEEHTSENIAQDIVQIMHIKEERYVSLYIYIFLICSKGLNVSFLNA